ncbi:hypothetical protein [Methylobacterium sp. WL6]|uniref:hypothetical protein n=1 Tax=Methylobacterium sp. WL6 TaxID=2603901 RepID=UPI0011CC805B|nr:hypothetical protein [Methylobacterium sp. WL6]TXN73424.1 hypothetical protein FV230_01245 [Methylobacterium sp. WL6]
MSRRATAFPYVVPPADMAPIYDALAETMATVATYAENAARFAEIRDPRGLAYAVRSAAACLMAAADLVEEVRPSRQNGERAA